MVPPSSVLYARNRQSGGTSLGATGVGGAHVDLPGMDVGSGRR